MGNGCQGECQGTEIDDELLYRNIAPIAPTKADRNSSQGEGHRTKIEDKLLYENQESNLEQRIRN
jgi:hypothetical protein